MNVIDSWRSTGLLLVQYWLLLLAKYRQRRYANFWHGTGWVLAVYNIRIGDINRHRNLIDSCRLTGLLLVQYCLLLLAKYRQRRYANFRHSTGWEMTVYNIQIGDINRHWNLIDSWGSTGLLLVQYWLFLLAKYRQRRYVNLGDSTCWVLALYNILIRDVNWQNFSR